MSLSRVQRYLVLDEADRMIDLGFEEDIRTIFSYFKVAATYRIVSRSWCIPGTQLFPLHCSHRGRLCCSVPPCPRKYRTLPGVHWFSQVCTCTCERKRDCLFMHWICLHVVTVNVGRAGAASLDVIQEVDYVKQEAKVVYLLECLQKTPPPVSSIAFLATYMYVPISFLIKKYGSTS